MVAVSADDYAWFTEQCPEIAGTCRLTLVRGRTPTEVIEQLGGSTPARSIGVRRLTEQLESHPARFVAAAAIDGWTLIVEPDTEPDMRAGRQLSRETVLVAHSAESFLWARDGEILLQFDPADPAHRAGTDPNTLTPAMSRLGFDTGEAPAADTDENSSLDGDAGWGDAARHRERSLALAEQLTGVRITLEALEAATFSCAALPNHNEPGHPAAAEVPAAQSVTAQSVPSARPERWDEEYDAPAEDDDWSDPDTDEPDGDTDDREWPRLVAKSAEPSPEYPPPKH
ncbi:DUF6461 domain-containing protein [Actinoplanes sp. CA-015351]|uniref:DUF6461 domain-containing protein n=1 Tax=Actinoplanes sp. CA-015351 TaxID=3239897 RepID=UPI003D9990B0